MQQPADAIPVDIFRQIFHWPLIPSANCPKSLDLGPWEGKKVDPLDLLGTDTNARRNTVQEFNYFHDFIQRFLYENDEEKRAFTLFKRTDLKQIDVHLKGAVHEFSVERLTLHRFGTGNRPVLLTLETRWQKRTEGDGPLMLDEAQKLIDYTRRSYAPFWYPSGANGRCANAFTLHWDGKPPQTHEIDSRPSEVFEMIAAQREDDVPVFDHWREIAGLQLKGDAAGCHWRDPSDERIPCMSLILLKKDCIKDNRAVLRQISDSDWLRLVDAEEPGNAWPYNPDFAADMLDTASYDRFFPDDKMSGNFATRHLFGGAHYACVGVADDIFGLPVLQEHFRRHYAQMGMMIRFEYTSLLAFSSRLTRAVTDLHGRATKHADETFIDEVSGIHADFLQFVNRFRFTGVSSQDQGRDMFARWRESLGLDVLFDDVSNEMETTAAYVGTERERQRSDLADVLSRLAHYAAAVALVIGLASMPIWSRMVAALAGCANGCSTTKHTIVESLLVIIVAFLALTFMQRLLKRPRRR